MHDSRHTTETHCWKHVIGATGFHSCRSFAILDPSLETNETFLAHNDWTLCHSLVQAQHHTLECAGSWSPTSRHEVATALNLTMSTTSTWAMMVAMTIHGKSHSRSMLDTCNTHGYRSALYNHQQDQLTQIWPSGEEFAFKVTFSDTTS